MATNLTKQRRRRANSECAANCNCPRCRVEKLISHIRYGDEFGRDMHPLVLETLKSIAPLLLLMNDNPLLADFYLDMVISFAIEAQKRETANKFVGRRRRKEEEKLAQPILLIEAHRRGTNRALEIVGVWNSSELMTSEVTAQDISYAFNPADQPISDFAYLIKVTDPAPDNLYFAARWAAHDVELSEQELFDICCLAPHFNEGIF